MTRSRELLEWVSAHPLPSGVLAEQVHPYTGAPLSVSPLTWSHAAFVESVHQCLDCRTALTQAARTDGAGSRAVGRSETIATDELVPIRRSDG